MIRDIIRKTVYSVLFYSGITGIFIRHFIAKKKDLPIVVLIYHGISKDPRSEINSNQSINHSLRNFNKEMRFLRKYFDVVTLDDAVKYIASGNASKRLTVAITFDDGYENNYTLAFPVLKKLNLPATIFLTTGYISTDDLPLLEKMGRIILNTKITNIEIHSSLCDLSCGIRSLSDKRKAFDLLVAKLNELKHDERIRLVDEVIAQLGKSEVSEPRMMAWKQIKDMEEYNISFGAHTVSHPSLSRMPVESARKEILESKRNIEERLGAKVSHFAYPFGFADDFNEDLKEYCKKIGFESVSSAIYGVNRPNADVYELKRISPGETVPIFAGKLAKAFLKN